MNVQFQLCHTKESLLIMRLLAKKDNKFTAQFQYHKDEIRALWNRNEVS